MGIKNRMKLWSTAALCGFAACIGTPADAAIQDDLIGLWQMDQDSGNDAVDSVNGNTAVWQDGGDSVGWVAGQIGNASNQSGAEANKWIINEITQMDGATGLTLSGWFNTNNVGGYKGILMSRTLEDSSGAGANWGLAREGSVGNLNVDGRVRAGGWDSAGGSVVPETWQHAVITWDGAGDASLYLDAAHVVTNASSLTSIIDSGTWYLGDDNCCGNRTFNGELDDVGVWRRSLSAGDVQAIYDRGQESISAEHAFATVSSALQKDLVAHWSLDQAAFTTTAYDSKNNNDGTLTNTAPGNADTGWVDGNTGGAFDFNGAGDYVKTGSDIGDGASAITLSVWVNLDAKTNWDGFLTSKGDFFGLQLDGDGGQDAHFRAMGVPFYSDIELNEGEWYHLVGVWDSGVTQQLYVNGVAVAAATGTGPVASGTIDVDEWIIGRDRELPNDGGRYADGLIDDAAIWTRALSAYEIAELHAGGLAGLNAQQVVVPTPAAGVGGLVLIGMLGSRRRNRA